MDDRVFRKGGLQAPYGRIRCSGKRVGSPPTDVSGVPEKGAATHV